MRKAKSTMHFYFSFPMAPDRYLTDTVMRLRDATQIEGFTNPGRSRTTTVHKTVVDTLCI